METKEIIENNKLIAEFMGIKIDSNLGCGNFHFNDLWGRLMPIVEKIESLEINGLPYIFTMTTCNIFIEHPLENSYIVQVARTENMMVDIYLSVVEFIKWFNNH